MSEALSVTTIIRTAAAPERAGLLERALASVFAQEGVDSHCVVVVNGPHADPAIVARLQNDPRITCIVDYQAGKPEATAIGRLAVRTEFFTFLDDDDEFLPGGLALRARVLRENPELVCVATNGEYLRDGELEHVFRKSTRIAKDYAGLVLRHRNWLASCGGTFRSDRVGIEYFLDLPPHREWTLIAYRIASHLPVRFLDVATYRVHSTPQSQSKTQTYVESGVDVARAMMAWNTRPARIPAILRCENDAYRLACSYHRVMGDIARAWHYYRKSIMSPFGVTFLPYGALLLARERRPVPALLGRRTQPREHKPGLPLWLLAILAVGILLEEQPPQW